MNQQRDFDYIILGSGIAGYSAAITLAKASQSVSIFELYSEAVIRGLFTINPTPLNPTEIEGSAFDDILWKICTPLGIERCICDVKDIIVDQKKISLIVDEFKKDIWSTQSIIFAPSFSYPKVQPNWIQNAKNCLGRGLSFCAWSDMPFCKEKSVCVIGDGYRAYDQICWALYYTNDVTFLCTTPTYQAGCISELALRKLIPIFTDIQIDSIYLHEQKDLLIIDFFTEGRKQHISSYCVFWASEWICDWSILGGREHAKQLEKQGIVHFAGITNDISLWDHNAQYQDGIQVAKLVIQNYEKV